MEERILTIHSHMFDSLMTLAHCLSSDDSLVLTVLLPWSGFYNRQDSISRLVSVVLCNLQLLELLNMV